MVWGTVSPPILTILKRAKGDVADNDIFKPWQVIYRLIENEYCQLVKPHYHTFGTR